MIIDHVHCALCPFQASISCSYRVPILRNHGLSCVGTVKLSYPMLRTKQYPGVQHSNDDRYLVGFFNKILVNLTGT